MEGRDKRMGEEMSEGGDHSSLGGSRGFLKLVACGGFNLL